MIDDELILQSHGGVQINSLRHTLNIHNEDDDESYHIDIIKHSKYYDKETLFSTLKDKKKCFSILSTNIESLNAKYDELDIFIEQMKDHGCEPSAICLQETWLSENHDTSQFQIDGYTCINQSKSCSNKGGLLIYL